MKLIYCPNCLDVRSLIPGKQYCLCRLSWGQNDRGYVIYGGKAIPLEFDDRSFLQAMSVNLPPRFINPRFIAWVVSDKDDVLQHVKKSSRIDTTLF